MDAPGTVPETINCHQCGAPIDLAGQTAFTHVECSRCNAVSVVPVKFGNFLLLNAMGIGGMGTVYKAIDLSLNRYLAVKILRKKLAGDPKFIENFAREARAAASINHLNIAQVYSFGEQDGQYYLAMELLERGSLDDRMMRLGKLPEKDVLDIGAQIAAGLRAAHQRGLLHRDIKPGNILFNDENIPKLVDFGLARAQHEATGEESGMIWGTPYYIAPEKMRGQTEDFRSDMYSLGATLFHALAGRPPFDAKTASEVVAKHATTPAFSLKTFVPDVQDFTAHVIGRMLAKEPAERYETYDALIHDLHEAERLLREFIARPTLVTETGERISIGSVIGTLVSLVVCGLIIWYVIEHRHKFGWESAPPPTAPAAVEPTRAGPTLAPAAPVEDVDFNSDEPWVRSWSVATLQLTQGKFNDAFFGYDGALYQIPHARVRHRQWIYFYEAITLMASDRPGEARRLLAERARDPNATGIPPITTVASLINPLILVLLDEIPVADLAGAIPAMPSWAAGLAHLTLGFKQIEAGHFAQARDAFRAYHSLPVDETQRWAFNLQPLADRLARDSDRAATAVAQIDALEAEGKPEAALESLRALAKKTKMPALKAALAARESRLLAIVEQITQQSEQARQLAEAERQAREKQLGEKLAGELQRLQTLDAAAAAAYQQYDFRAGLSRYDNADFETESARQLLEQRRALGALLDEFKMQLSADFTRQPYDSAQLQTRNRVTVQGRLSRATDTQLIFSTPYGELVANWTDLPPATLQRVGEHYATAFAATERPASLARRYLLLAAFAKQFGSDRMAAYLKQAAQLAPEVLPEIEKAFGKS